jgi:hypothetical protein
MGLTDAWLRAAKRASEVFRKADGGGTIWLACASLMSPLPRSFEWHMLMA